MDAIGRRLNEFYNLGNVDYTKPCNNMSFIAADEIILPTGAIISILCYCYILHMYFFVNSTVLRRHPTNLAIFKCIFSIGLVQQYLWLPFLNTNTFYDDQYSGEPPYYCNASSTAAGLSFMTQCCLIASQLCFLVISMDLRYAYANPFSSFEHNKYLYAALVIGLSLGSGFLLLIFGDEVYGISSEGTVWVQDRRAIDDDGVGSYPVAKFILYYIIIGWIYLYSIWANFQSYQTGSSNSDSTRVTIMERSKKYTVAYLFYQSTTLLLEFVSFLFPNSKACYSLPSYFYCMMGLWDLIVITYSNWESVSWETLNPVNIRVWSEVDDKFHAREKEYQPHLNEALRSEILFFSTRGIMHAALYSCKDVSRRVSTTSVLNETGEGQEAEMNMDVTYKFVGQFPSANKGVKTDDSISVFNDRDMFAEMLSKQSEAVSEQFDQEYRSSMRRMTNGSKSESVGSSSKITTGSMGGLSKPFVDNPMMTPSDTETNPDEGSSATFSADSPSLLSLSGISDSSAKWQSRKSKLDVESGSSRASEQEMINPTVWQQVRSSENNTPAHSRACTASNDGSTVDLVRQQIVGLQNWALTMRKQAHQLFSQAHLDFRFKDFCPVYFREVRDMCNICDEDYSECFKQICKESFSEGRSGAFMYYSRNQKCMVKTTSKSELLALVKVMREYVVYLRDNKSSLICRFLGAHCITMYGVEKYFVVMLNVFPQSPLSERYDLKGSWVNRHGYKGGRQTRTERMKQESSGSKAPLYQDNDLQHKISLMGSAKPFKKQIIDDVEFLRSLKFMDYSLLIGVKTKHFYIDNLNGEDTVSLNPVFATSQRPTFATNLDQDSDSSIESSQRPFCIYGGKNGEDPFSRDWEGGMRASQVKGAGTYYFGIIDVLQEWNWTKRFERYIKMYFYRKDPEGLSCIDPDRYADRFIDYVVKDTFEFEDNDHDDDNISIGVEMTENKVS